jgi:hypothetical protein
MTKRQTSQTLFAIGLGAALGYVAAAGCLDAPRSALAANEPRSGAPSAFAPAERLGSPDRHSDFR